METGDWWRCVRQAMRVGGLLRCKSCGGAMMYEHPDVHRPLAEVGVMFACLQCSRTMVLRPPNYALEYDHLRAFNHASRIPEQQRLAVYRDFDQGLTHIEVVRKYRLHGQVVSQLHRMWAQVRQSYPRPKRGRPPRHVQLKGA